MFTISGTIRSKTGETQYIPPYSDVCVSCIGLKVMKLLTVIFGVSNIQLEVLRVQCQILRLTGVLSGLTDDYQATEELVLVTRWWLVPSVEGCFLFSMPVGGLQFPDCEDVQPGSLSSPQWDSWWSSHSDLNTHPNDLNWVSTEDSSLSVIYSCSSVKIFRVVCWWSPCLPPVWSAEYKV